MTGHVSMSHIMRKSVFGGAQVRLKLACSAKEVSKSLEISDIATKVIRLCRQWRTKDLIRAHADLCLYCSHNVINRFRMMWLRYYPVLGMTQITENRNKQESQEALTRSLAVYVIVWILFMITESQVSYCFLVSEVFMRILVRRKFLQQTEGRGCRQIY